MTDNRPGTSYIKPVKIRRWRIKGLMYTNDGFPHGSIRTGAAHTADLVDVPSQGGESNLRKNE